MGRKIVRAKDVTVGTVLAGGLDHGCMSVKEVYTESNPVFGREDIVIRGPLGIILKRHPESQIVILD